MGQWYEAGAAQGIQLWVAQNEGAYNYLWWGVDSMTAFTGSCDPGNTCGQASYTSVVSTLQNPANEYYCLALDTTAEEAACLQTAASATYVTNTVTTDACTSVSDDSSSSSDNSKGWSIAATVFSLVNSVLLVVLASKAMGAASRPLSASSSSVEMGGKV